MNRTELIAALAQKTGTKKTDAASTLDALQDIIFETLANGEKIQVVGFGTLEVKERAARVGRNPRTGEPADIAASRVPSFKAGKALKEAVNK